MSNPYKCIRCGRPLNPLERLMALSACVDCTAGNFQGGQFDGDEEDSSDPAFLERINEMKVGELAAELIRMFRRE